MARSDLLLRLERPSAVPLRDQLYAQLREALVAGRLRRGRRLSAQLWQEAGSGDLWYGDPLGPLELRRAIAGWVGRSRAVRCAPDRIAVTSGAQQAVAMLARLLVDPGDVVAVEDPGYRRAQQAFRVEGARLAPVPVDAQGLRVGSLPPDARIVHVTPSHQYPLGMTLAVDRRLAL